MSDDGLTICAMPAQKANHHVVPRFYLKRFAKNGDLREYRRGVFRHVRSTIADATAVSHLYTVDTRDGDESDGFENAFSAVEDKAARVFRTILDSGVWPLENRARNDLATWLAVQYMRTPRFRRALESDVQGFRREFGKLLTYDEIHAALGRPTIDRKEVLRIWNGMLGHYPTSGPLPRNLHVSWLRSLAPDLAKNLFERDWFLVRYPTPRYLFSDCLIVGLLAGNRIAGPREFGASATIAVPLDRSTGLLLIERSARPRGDALAPQRDEHARALNNITVAHADTSVFEHPDDAFFPGWAVRPTASLARLAGDRSPPRV
jgi:hypothetical protein